MGATVAIRFSAAKQSASASAHQFLVGALPPVYEPDIGWDRHAQVWNAWARGAAGVVATGRGASPWLAARDLVTQMREQKLVTGGNA